MISDLASASAMRLLERLVQFTGQRHRLIAHNITRLDAPGLRPQNVSFQARLCEAVEARRAAGPEAELRPEDSRQVEFRPGGLMLNPGPIGQYLPFPDGDGRDPDRTMQDLVESFLLLRTAAELLRGRMNLIDTAIAERV